MVLSCDRVGQFCVSFPRNISRSVRLIESSFCQMNVIEVFLINAFIQRQTFHKEKSRNKNKINLLFSITCNKIASFCRILVRASSLCRYVL